MREVGTGTGEVKGHILKGSMARVQRQHVKMIPSSKISDTSGDLFGASFALGPS